MDKKTHLRIHHPNVIASFGTQNFNFFADKFPSVFSGWVLGGVQKDNVTVFGGLHSAFDTKNHIVPFAGLLVGLKHKKFTGFVDYNCKRSLTKPVVKGEVATTTDANTSTTTEKPIYNTHELKVTFDAKVDDKLSVSGETTTDLSKITSVALVGEYDLGSGTALKLKVITLT